MRAGGINVVWGLYLHQKLENWIYLRLPFGEIMIEKSVAPERARAADHFHLSLAAALARRPRSHFALERANPGRRPPSFPMQW